MATMSSTTIVFGMLLTLLGLAGYFLTGAVLPSSSVSEESLSSNHPDTSSRF